MSVRTIEFEVEDLVATVTLNRVHHHNAFTQQMMDEVCEVWDLVRRDDGIRAVVLRAAGDQAFCTGHDVSEELDWPANVWSRKDPAHQLGPKTNELWKPVICAVNGMICGGGFYLMNESDIVICSDNATFFDPHVSYGQVSGAEAVGLARRVPLGEALRIALIGLDERMSAQRALTIGLVSEVVPFAHLRERAHDIATTIAAKPAAAVQGTVRAIWESEDLGRTAAVRAALNYCSIGNPIGKAEVDRSSFVKPDYRLR
jgi:enoyl-CoA hydratase/carnithine racemase